MDNLIGISRPIPVSAPTVPSTSAKAAVAPSLPLPGSSAVQGVPEQVTFDAQAAEQTRQATVQRAAEQIANTYVLGDQTFSLFKDSTGVYITRFTNLRDGKVTYIPEPTLFKMTNPASDLKPLVTLKA